MKKLCSLALFFALFSIFSSCKKSSDFQKATAPSNDNDAKKSVASTAPPYPSEEAMKLATAAPKSLTVKSNVVDPITYYFTSYNPTTGASHVILHTPITGHTNTYYYSTPNTGTGGAITLGQAGSTAEFDIVLSIPGNWEFSASGDNGQAVPPAQFTVPTKPADPPAGYLNFYRYYNADFGKYYYTSNWNELGPIGGGNYVFEKVQGLIYANPGSNLVPLYQYFYSAGADHWYTTNSAGYPNYDYVGIMGYVPTFQTGLATAPLNEYFAPNIGHFYASPPESPSSPPYTFNTTTCYIIPTTAASTPTPFYRYSRSNGRHLYTINSSELTGNAAYNYDGVQCKIYAIQVTGTIPLYRFMRSSDSDYLYNTSSNPISGYVLEGPAGYVYSSPTPGTIPFYSFFKSSAGHFYTTNYAEGNNAGFNYEGATCYVYPN